MQNGSAMEIVWGRVCLAPKTLPASPTGPDCTRAVVPQTAHSWAALLWREVFPLYIHPPELDTLGFGLLELNLADWKVKARSSAREVLY